MPDVPEHTSLPPDAKIASEPIMVAEKILADISTGIYRTPAAALKELVANAYDADAEKVVITTGAPSFKHLTIWDDGDGMDLSRFLQVIRHIGGSWKRLEDPDGLTRRLRRPIIGRIGIGLLAVAQLGQRFYVSSTTKGSPTRFLAEIDLSSFHKDDAAMRTLGKSADEKGADTRVEIGSVRHVEGLPEPRESHFTVITVLNPKQGLVSELHGQLRAVVGADAEFTLEDPAPNYLSLAKSVLRAKRADTVLDSYHYVLWELGLLAPVPYFDNSVFADGDRRVEGAAKIVVPRVDSFSVTVDGFKIKRPLQYPNPCAVNYGGPSPAAYPVEHDSLVAGRRLRFDGYVYAQKPRIDPFELQGLQIRIRNVGIGGFDKTWMGYPFAEGLKFGQLTGEIYVHDGLESALNIDRASFRETDPHYLALRAYVWNLLRKQVFPAFKNRQAKWRSLRTAREQAGLLKRLQAALEDAPESVGVAPRISNAGAKPAPAGTRAAAARAAQQTVVAVEDGEAVLDGAALAKVAAELSSPSRDRLLRVCAVLAAHGLWDELSQDDAENLLKSLAVAVDQ